MFFDHHSQPLLPRRQFVRRLARYAIYALAIIVFSLFLGMVGYHLLGRLDWIDSFLNASMILTGMGPVNSMPTAGGKLFSGLYAIYSGVIFLSVVAMMFTPIAHRLLHIFHLEGAEKSS